ncbi:MAG: folate-binding protein YgfZ [Ardenticatenaceae bacterium]|nr:folate-binding protein YgfZ [Anaerolineales bacterium]MCB8923205.1 folate-binding protein YgfZ [Ardenticatenaceae bacterium]MCB9004850.1 folate-binding protein YgfZ [Ardenticatenaceae bacterium]
MTSQIHDDVNRAAQETAVLVDRSQLACFKISGASRLDILHRISTNAVKQLPPGAGAATVLTTNIGRIIDRLILYADSDSVTMLAGENHRDPLARYLLRNVFFQDDFQLADVTDETAVLAIYGPQSQTLLTQAGFGETDLPLHHWRSADINGIPATLHKTDPINDDGYFILCSTNAKDALQTHLQANGITPADEAAFDYLRIAAGLPRYGRELTLDYIPLEADLWADVSFNKGCYTGQEIIARLESRGRLAKRLVKLTTQVPITAGTDILADGKSVGTVTSTAVGPLGAVALGYVKTAVLDEKKALTVGEETAVTPSS